MNDHQTSAGAGPSPTYEPPPTPNSERPGSAYLILGINVLLMAGAIWYVWHRQQGKDGAGGTNVSNDPATTAQAPGDPAARPVVGTKGLLDARSVKPSDPWSTLSSHKPGTASKQVYDAATTEKMDATGVEIHDIGVEMEVLRAVRGAYPTSNVATNDKNRGVEALLEALRKSGRDAGLKLIVGDTDGDGREEILDQWGRPLIYISGDDYGTAQQWSEGDVVSSKDPKTGEFSAKMRFQLWSVGSNGRNDGGAADDVASWQIHKSEE
jgi:hypothetical protein